MSAPAQTLDVEPTMSPEDVSRLTGLHYQSVLAEVKCGALRARKIRGRYLITRAAYEAWLDPADAPAAQPAPAPRATPTPMPSRRPPEAGSVARLKALEGGGTP